MDGQFVCQLTGTVLRDLEEGDEMGRYYAPLAGEAEAEAEAEEDVGLGGAMGRLFMRAYADMEQENPFIVLPGSSSHGGGPWEARKRGRGHPSTRPEA